MGIINDKRINHIVQTILEDYEDDRTINRKDFYNQPDKQIITDVIAKLFKVLYPGYFSDKVYKYYSLKNNVSALIEDIIYHLHQQIAIALRYNTEWADVSDKKIEEKSEIITFDFMEKIPQIRATLETDIQAAFDGDPAAGSKEEIIFSYPGLYAVTVYRIAHELFLLGVPMIPRIMTEHAHSVTGIDIHPGASIGKYFFIDHGTGIVVGETTVIGEHVKMYQGVTLGGLSTKGGQKLKGVRRHPSIMDNVTLYSGSSILGGETVIGENVVIGGNAFITKSVEKDTRVSMKEPELNYKNKKG